MSKQNVQKKQKEQKKLYDKQCKEIELKVAVMVMLKIQPRFCLDQKYEGPFIIKVVTPTNMTIQLKDDNTAVDLCASRQLVSVRIAEMSHSTPWIWHTKKLQKIRKLKKRADNGTAVNDNPVSEATAVREARVSSKGRQMTPARFPVMDSSKAIQEK